jgi:hypothetical protein
MDGGAPEPVLWASEHELLVAYFTPDADKVAVLRFNSWCHKFGYPNEEVLSGHPLYQYGFDAYGFHIVENSPWITELCRQNRVHSRHSDSLFADLRHWLITFHDTTLEVVGRQASVVGVFDATNPEQALLNAKSHATNVA